MVELRENRAKALWEKAVSHILEEGEEYIDSDGRRCKEVLNLTLTLENASKDGAESPINTMVSSKEWLYPSKEELSSIIFKKASAPAYEYTYGGRIFNFSEKLDQINTVIIPQLKANPSSRRAVVVVYDPLKDSTGRNHNVPAMMYINFRLKDDRLFSTTHFRSSEVFFGWPANLFQIFKLHEFVAGELSVDIGDLSIISNSSHLFLEDLKHIRRFLDIS